MALAESGSDGTGGAFGDGMEEGPDVCLGPYLKTQVEGLVPDAVVDGGWNTGEDSKLVVPDLQLVWSGITVASVEDIIRGVLGEDVMKTTTSNKGLEVEDREALKEGWKESDDKTVEDWLEFSGVVWKMALGDLRMEDWMVRVKSADDLQFILLSTLGCRGKVGMSVKEDLPAWRKVYVSLV